MQLTRAGYLADFYVYPGFALALAALALAPAPRPWPALACAAGAGLVTWTLLEYVLHRWLFHRVSWIREQHEAHHRDPQAFVGTPTWLSLLAISALVMLPSLLEWGVAIGSSFTAGLALGYLWYAAVHYAVHHWRATPGSALFRLKRLHAMHHHREAAANFGVTTPFWDRVFRTSSR
ncbi:MAG: Fatty acid hydroxylase superfamily protein [Ramlibacter sp.]|nr:Fatty acid hydroxylase superfamily protein [Ramlibacter sp.]